MARIGWETFEQDIDRLADQIDPDEYKGIVAMLRGGMVPARLLASRLAINDMFAVRVVKRDTTRIVTAGITEDLADRRLLLVEDVLESGRSLEAASRYLREIKGAEVATAALYFTPQSEVLPDYSLGLLPEVPELPWE